ncbi:MAG: hypothetical protein Q4C04_00280 [Clostridia bacterium]|nr:hypothetical protein [Clostridia bacterium]
MKSIGRNCQINLHLAPPIMPFEEGIRLLASISIKNTVLIQGIITGRMLNEGLGISKYKNVFSIFEVED